MNVNLEKNRSLLEKLIRKTETVDFETKILMQYSTVSFYKRLLSSAKAILLLTDDQYNGCIIASHMLESLIQLVWMTEEEERIRQYIDYGVVEQIEGIKIYPENREKILNYIKENNVQRFLKKKFSEDKITDKILLQHENYYKLWYNPEANSIKTIVEKLTKNDKHKEIANIYYMYERLCSYKHCSPYVMMPRYSPRPVQDTPDELFAISISMHCLYICCLLVNKYQKNPIDLEDITEEYQKVLGIDWMPSE